MFTNDGTFLGQIASDTKEGGTLQSPWGLAFIKHSFGQFSDDLLVGNFSSGQIDAYKVTWSAPTPTAGRRGLRRTGRTLLNTNGTPLTIPGLRSIHFGPGLGIPGVHGHTHVALLFTADTANLSLYGEITPAKVKLVTGMATGTSGISNIQQVNGSGQGDVLVGNASGVLPVETAAKNLIIGGADGGAMLDSGAGQDIVIAGSTIYNNGAGDTSDLGSAYDWLFSLVGIDAPSSESQILKLQTFIWWDVPVPQPALS